MCVVPGMLISTEGIRISFRLGGFVSLKTEMCEAKLELSEWMGENIRKNILTSGVKIPSGTTQCRLFWKIIFVLGNKVWKAMEAIFIQTLLGRFRIHFTKKFFSAQKISPCHLPFLLGTQREEG